MRYLPAQAPACPPVQVALTRLTWEKRDEMGTCPLGGRQLSSPSPTKGLCVLHLLLSGSSLLLAQTWPQWPPQVPALPNISPSSSAVFSFSSHKNVSAGPGLPSHPIVNNTALPLPTGQAQTCPRGSPPPPAGVLTHLFTFGPLPRTEQELHLTPDQRPLPVPCLPCCSGLGVESIPTLEHLKVQFNSEGGLAPNTIKSKGSPWGLSDESRWTPECPVLRAESGRPPSSKLVAFLMATPVMFPAGSGEGT